MQKRKSFSVSIQRKSKLLNVKSFVEALPGSTVVGTGTVLVVVGSVVGVGMSVKISSVSVFPSFAQFRSNLP